MEMALREKIALKRELWVGESNNSEKSRNEPLAFEEKEGTSKPKDKQGEEQDPYPVFRPWMLAYWLDSVKSLILSDVHQAHKFSGVQLREESNR